MPNAKRASMREGPLAALFRKTAEDTGAPGAPGAPGGDAAPEQPSEAPVSPGDPCSHARGRAAGVRVAVGRNAGCAAPVDTGGFGACAGTGDSVGCVGIARESGCAGELRRSDGPGADTCTGDPGRP